MKISCLLFIIFFITSCKSSDNEIIQIDLGKTAGHEITLSSLADEITYVPLDNSYTMSIYFQRTEIINDTIYLNEKDNGMFALDKSGKMVRMYGKRGRGPGEYILGFRYAIDQDGRILYLLDKKKILKFSLDGSYLGDISLEKYPGHFSEIRFRDSKLVVFEYISFGEAVYDWIVIDTAGNLIKEKYNYVPSFKTNYGSPGGVYEYGDKIYYWNSINDTVFSISQDLNYQASFLFEPSDLRSPKYDHTMEVDDFNRYINLSTVLESDSFIILRYFFEKSIMLFVDKSTGQLFKATWNINEGGLINDLDGGASFEPKHYFKKEGREYLVGYTQATDIISRVHSDDFKNYTPKYPDGKEALKSLAENLKETDNTLLTIVRLKD